MAAKVSGKGMDYAATEASKMFATSAAVGTPPNPGSSSIPKKKFNRDVEPIESDGNTIGFKVPFWNSKRKGCKEFKPWPIGPYTSLERAEEAAKAFSFIEYRGESKAGWWGLLDTVFGVSISKFKAGVKVPRVLREISSAKITRGNFSTLIELTNSVKGIGRFGAYAARHALGKTNIRMKWWIKQLQKDVSTAWK